MLDLAKTDGGEFQLPLKSDASGPFTVKPNMPLLPYFPKGHHVTLKNWWSSENGVDCYLRAQNGEQRTPDSRAENEDGTGVNGQSLPPRDHCRVEGSYYSYCQPAPLCASDSSPQEEHLLWKLVYTGVTTQLETSALGEPQFWIVTDDEQWVLCSCVRQVQQKGILVELGKMVRLIHKRRRRGCGSPSPGGKELGRWRPARATGL